MLKRRQWTTSHTLACQRCGAATAQAVHRRRVTLYCTSCPHSESITLAHLIDLKAAALPAPELTAQDADLTLL